MGRKSSEYMFRSKLPDVIAGYISRTKASYPSRSDIQKATGISSQTVDVWLRRGTFESLNGGVVWRFMQLFGVDALDDIVELIPNEDTSNNS